MTIVVAYSATRAPLRASVAEHLHAFEAQTDHPCVYVNLAIRRPPRSLRHIPVALVVYHTSLLDARWSRRWFQRLMDRAEALDAVAAPKIALPQDEYISTDLLETFLERRRVGHVFSCAPSSQWPLIYPALSRLPEVTFRRVLTGYIGAGMQPAIDRIGAPERSIDISYRAWAAPAWLGRHGRIKAELGSVVGPRAVKAGLITDISTRREDTLYGTDWYRMLLRSRWVLGVEGGASVLDRDGSVRAAAERYLRRNPGATADEVERRCFADREGTIDYRAISPRHLEACATRTGQILVEGEYNGILEAGRHYLALRPDFSNLDEVLEQSLDEDLRKRLVDAAYEDVVASGRYTYARLVETVFSAVWPDGAPTAAPLTPQLRRRLAALHLSDRLSWPAVRGLRYGIDATRSILGIVNR